MVKVDIKSFFRSVSQTAVYAFFCDTMKCEGDVAGMLARLLTVEGHLPTGSSASPIMSFYAHKNMFDEIAEMARARGLEMTVYVDDMCISGEQASRQFLYEVRRIIARHGLRSHKAHYFAAKRPKVVTGVMVGASGIQLPNRRHKRIKNDLDSFLAESDNKKKLEILIPLISRVHEAAQIDPAWLPKARTLIGYRRKIEAGLRTTGKGSEQD